MTAVPSRLVVAVTALAVGLSACSGAVIPESTSNTFSATTVRPSTTTTLPLPTTVPTTVVPTTVAPGQVTVVPPGLGRGASGAAVQSLEEKLTTLRYEVGKADGVFDAMTGHGVMAFQKAEGLLRTGRATDDVVAALGRASAQVALVPEGGADRVEIDLKRQVLLLWKGGKLERVLNTATGNNKRYCVDGQCATAVTPGGSFRVTRKIRGLRVSRLGQLYNPLYFNGGIAIHGSPSVPANPASHGCVRIPMGSSLWFHDTVFSGTPVYVVGGKTAPVPFGELAPPEEATTTTTTPPTTTSTTTVTTLLPPILTTPTTVATTTTTTSTTSTTTTSTVPPSP